MKLTYIWHDCFLLESVSANLIFDFWKDPCSTNDGLPRFIEYIDKDKPLYVFVSHHHKDHYNKSVFEWSRMFRHIHFVISHDTARFARHILKSDSIYKGVKPKPESVTILRPGERYYDGIVRVEAFGSTDIGNSYVFEIDGFTGFHSGDLNAWIWKDESTDKEVEKALSDFRNIVETIHMAHPRIDYAMFPVDSRIGSGFFTGAYEFVRIIDVAHFFPMHFGLGDSMEEQKRYRLDAARTDLYRNKERGEFICLQAPYSTYADSSGEST